MQYLSFRDKIRRARMQTQNNDPQNIARLLHTHIYEPRNVHVGSAWKDHIVLRWGLPPFWIVHPSYCPSLPLLVLLL